jgi:hypothetical protein
LIIIFTTGNWWDRVDDSIILGALPFYWYRRSLFLFASSVCRVVSRISHGAFVVSNCPLVADGMCRHVPLLYNQGVRGVVNTCDEYAGPVQTYARYGIEQLRYRLYPPPPLFIGRRVRVRVRVRWLVCVCGS